MNNSLIRYKVEIFSTVTIQSETEKQREKNRKRRKDQRIQHLANRKSKRGNKVNWGKKRIAKENM